MLQAKLAAEGLFDPERKRSLPYPPSRIGLITSIQSAAYADFIKILNARWQGIDIEVIDVLVQGEAAPAQLMTAIEHFNAAAQPPELLVLIRGGGSAEDLAAFSYEALTRAVAASRVPTMVAIGHEVDLSLAELAADARASTPSNAAELLVPDRQQVKAELKAAASSLNQAGSRQLQAARLDLKHSAGLIEQNLLHRLQAARERLLAQRNLLAAINPQAVLRRGYAIVRKGSKLVRSTKGLAGGDIVKVQLSSGGFRAAVDQITEEASGR